MPLLIGTNLNEESYFICPTEGNLTASGYNDIVNESFADPQELLQVLLFTALFPNLPSQLYPLSSYSSPVQAYIDLSSDEVFKCPSKELADTFGQNPAKAPVFMYSFNNQPSYLLVRKK